MALVVHTAERDDTQGIHLTLSLSPLFSLVAVVVFVATFLGICSFNHRQAIGLTNTHRVLSSFNHRQAINFTNKTAFSYIIPVHSCHKNVLDQSVV